MSSDYTQNIDDLTSKSPSDRARAAGWLVQHPRAIPTRILMNALQSETVPQVRRLLLLVLEARATLAGDVREPEALESRSSIPDNPSAPPGSLGRLDIAALVRHELSPAVGWIRAAADGEIEKFGSSKTNDAIRKLQRRIDGLVAMIKSNEALNSRRVSLPALLVENWPDSNTRLRMSPSPTDDDVEIETDEGLFSILVSNIFQNAIDASVEFRGAPDVQVTWGYTDRSFWVRIVNPFRGDRLAMTDVIDVGSSTKRAHQGQGLSLISTAARRLDLSVALEGASGTASFSLSGRLPHD